MWELCYKPQNIEQILKKTKKFNKVSFQYKNKRDAL